MKKYNHNQLSSARTFFGLLAAMMFLVSGGRAVAATCGCAAAGNQAVSTLSKCRTDLAKRLKLKEEEIKLADAQTVTWPDAGLGMPEIGKVYAQVQTPGEKLILQAGGTNYLYTTGAGSFRYGGPLPLWACSMLFLQPVQNEANLNSDLYQCSMLGTNCVKLASGVTDYYPQDKGTVIIKRRTSRSGHDLLYIKADEPGKENMLYQAFDFGDAAFDRDQDRWAGYVRSRVGGKWTVVIAEVGQDKSKALTLDLPDEVKPAEIAWSDDMLMIMVTNRKDRKVAFEVNPADESPVWKQVDNYTFPGYDDYVLNKSESLDIDQVDEDGKPAVEVARVWFTGDRNVVAKIVDFKMKGCDLLGPYAFIWGEQAGVPAAYTVDIYRGDLVVGFPGTGTNIKPFIHPPHNSPIPKAPRMDS